MLSQAIRAWDRLGVSTPWFTGSPGVVPLDELWLGRGKESMTASSTARMRDSIRRRVAEGTARQALAGEGERKHDVRMARIIDSTGRRVVEGTAGRALVGEGERKHDGEGGEDERQYKERVAEEMVPW
jgi:hypothetical protein